MSPAPTISIDDADVAILRAADQLFYRQGVAAVTMAAIRDEAGVSMRRLYSLYPSKADLIAGWLQQRHITWTTNLHGDVQARVEEGAAPIDALFGSVEAWLVATGFRGCGFINTHAERSDFTSEHEAIIRTHKSELDSYVHQLFPGVPGLAVLLDGAIVQCAIFADTAPITSAHQAAVALVATAQN